LTELLAAAKYEKSLRLARADFWRFRLLMHKRLKVGWWQREVSEKLQQFHADYKAGLRPQLIITAPPQHGKSTIINDFLLWSIGKDSELSDSELKIIYASFSDALGVRANRRIQRYIATKRYQDIFPKFAPTHKTLDLILYGEDGYFRNTTIGGAITGESMTWGVIDDYTKGRAESNSATIRDKVWEWFTSDFSTRFSDDGAFLCICTRWHVDDLIGRLVEMKPSTKVLKYHALAEHDEPNRKQGEPLFPEHKSVEFLNDIKSVMSAAAWNSLYQQNPTIAEGNFFKPDFINTVDALPSGLQVVRAWDFAGTANGGDYTVGLKFGYDKHNREGYIIDIVRGQYAPEDVERVLLATAQADGRAVKILLPQDPAQAGKYQAKNFIKLLSGYSVTAERVTGDKETRASSVAAQANIGNIKASRGAWNRLFIEELRLFPNGVNDDQVDALSDSFNNFVNKKSGSF